MNQVRKQKATGFTLIELMIAVGIVAILVAMAVPAYKNYTTRAKIGECVNGAAIAKVAITEYRQTLGAWPPDLGQAGLGLTGVSQFCTALDDYQPSTGQFSINVNEAKIDPLLAIDSIEPILRPTIMPSNIVNWTCARGSTTVENLKYLPSTCRGT